jgi:peroxin-6
MSLTSATLLQKVVGCDINLPVLLKGQRGVGKFTIIERVAQELGLHLFEARYSHGMAMFLTIERQVNCYDVVEKDAERSLRDRFERAKLCSPCILVLRHIDAMAQTTQVAENGKGSAELHSTFFH